MLSARTIGRGLGEAVAKVAKIYGISQKAALEAIEREAFIEGQRPPQVLRTKNS